jgi:hypothetical protein
VQRSFSQSFHQAVLGPTGAYWLDGPPDLTCKDSTQQDAVDGLWLSCKQQIRVAATEFLPYWGMGMTGDTVQTTGRSWSPVALPSQDGDLSLAMLWPS